MNKYIKITKNNFVKLINNEITNNIENSFDDLKSYYRIETIIFLNDKYYKNLDLLRIEKNDILEVETIEKHACYGRGCFEVVTVLSDNFYIIL